ncbi:MAG TPA: MgtC/SapB family protein [Sphingomicrobium sp.]|nr:MgtC/SapB family protein [Sphingomicrobium sp.]
MIDALLGARHFDILPPLVALVVAYALAFPIGWNREREERSAGLRTFPLVAVASCGFVQAAEHLTVDQPEAMARIVEGLITGMGFIGGGAILRMKDSVKGTATAASLWVTGAIGTAVGLGSYDVAIVLALATVATLWILSGVKEKIGIDEEPAEPRSEDASEPPQQSR